MEVIFIIGSNTKETHPVIANRMIKAFRKGAKIIIADPRSVPMVKFADIFLRMRPGSDVALLNGIAHIIVGEGLQNDDFIRDRTEGFDAWKQSLRDFTPEKVEGITGVPREQIAQAARTYAKAGTAIIVYSLGLTEHSHGTDPGHFCSRHTRSTL